jgi:hypothetical protein
MGSPKADGIRKQPVTMQLPLSSTTVVAVRVPAIDRA